MKDYYGKPIQIDALYYAINLPDVPSPYRGAWRIFGDDESLIRVRAADEVELRVLFPSPVRGAGIHRRHVNLLVHANDINRYKEEALAEVKDTIPYNEGEMVYTRDNKDDKFNTQRIGKIVHKRLDHIAGSLVYSYTIISLSGRTLELPHDCIIPTCNYVPDTTDVVLKKDFLWYNSGAIFTSDNEKVTAPDDNTSVLCGSSLYDKLFN